MKRLVKKKIQVSEQPKEPAGIYPDWAEKRMKEKGELTPEETARVHKEYYDQADVQKQTLERIMRDRIFIGPPREEPKAEIKPPAEKPAIAEPVIPREKSLLNVWEDIQRRKGTPVEPKVEPPEKSGIMFIGPSLEKGVVVGERWKVIEPEKKPEIKPPETSIMTKGDELAKSILNGEYFKPKPKPEIRPPTAMPSVPTPEERETRMAEDIFKKPVRRVTDTFQISPRELVPGVIVERKEPETGSYNIQLTAKDVKAQTQVEPSMTPIEEQPVSRKIETKIEAASKALSVSDIKMKEKEDIRLKKEEAKLGIWEEKQYGKTLAKAGAWERREERGAPFFMGAQKVPVGRQTFEEFREKAERPMHKDYLEQRKVSIGADVQRKKETWLGKPEVRRMFQDVQTGEIREIVTEKAKPGILERFAEKALTPRKLRHLPTIPSMKRERDPRITEQWQRKKYFG